MTRASETAAQGTHDHPFCDCPNQAAENCPGPDLGYDYQQHWDNPHPDWEVFADYRKDLDFYLAHD